MRHQLRHGFGKRIIKELDWLSKSKNTTEATKPTLRQVRDYLNTHLDHIQYRSFKKLGLPIGSGMVESACKWLIQQRFKGVGMRWSEDGFNHLLHLRLAWVNQRFDNLFSDESLVLTLYSPNRACAPQLNSILVRWSQVAFGWFSCLEKQNVSAHLKNT